MVVDCTRDYKQTFLVYRQLMSPFFDDVRTFTNSKCSKRMKQAEETTTIEIILVYLCE